MSAERVGSQRLDVRVASSPDERAVVVHIVLGRSRLAIQVMAIAPTWLPFVRLPDSLSFDEGSFRELVAAVETAFSTYQARFARRV